MKKLILSLIAVAVGTLSSFAQSDLVATLSHGSSLSTFSGIDALAQAYAAAEEGDVITLSPGEFNGITVEKAVTIRGVGMIPMATNGFVSTLIAGDMPINVPSSSSSTLTIDGLHVLGKVVVQGNNLATVLFQKSRFDSAVTGFGVNLQALSCIFVQSLTATYRINSYSSDYRNTTIQCMNCVMKNAKADGYSPQFMAKIVATNCDVMPYYGGVAYCTFANCIIEGFYSGSLSDICPLPESCIVNNCIGINKSVTPDLFVNLPNNPSNIMVEGIGDEAYGNVFKTYLGTPSLAETYELTETAAATYLGDDGTQVGIYGGTNPFNPTPTNPQVKKFTVNSTTVGDQLKVKINVE